MAEMTKNKLLLLLALVLSVILIGGLIVMLTAGISSEVASVREEAVGPDGSTTESSNQSDGPASGARAAGIAGFSDTRWDYWSTFLTQ